MACEPAQKVFSRFGNFDSVVCPQNYANSYVGHARINRLVFIAEKTADAQLSLSALKLAADELKKVHQQPRWWFKGAVSL